MNDQLDMFEAAPAEPAAILFAFPLERRAKLVRVVARTLQLRKTQEGKQSYWSRTIRALKAELRDIKCSDGEIERQITGFRGAITDELARLQHDQRRAQ